MNNSDKNAKNKCIEHLKENGYEDCTIVKTGCDIECTKGGKKYFIEVKSSSKNKKEAYSGTVMLTELYKAVTDKECYKFLVCKGRGNSDNWEFKMFDVDEFIEYCSLTTPILHYAYHSKSKKQPKFRKDTIKASEDLIRSMNESFEGWEKKYKEEKYIINT